MAVKCLKTKVLRIGFALCIPFAGVHSVRAELAFDGVEYKFRFVPKVITAANRDRLWRLVGSDSSHVSQKKCRVIQFLDVSSDAVQKADFLIRHRAKLESTVCPTTVPKAPQGDLTLKYRVDDFKRAMEEAKKPWARIGDHKFEQDVALSEGHDTDISLDRAFSVSAKVEDAKVPTTIEALRRIYPDALAAIPDSSSLDVSCRRVLEERWALEPAESAELPGEVELTAWYRVSKLGKKEAEPILVELSFKGDLAKRGSRDRADRLAALLSRTLDGSWLAEGGSKTASILDCND